VRYRGRLSVDIKETPHKCVGFVGGYSSTADIISEMRKPSATGARII
jgi:hypothetical protein